MRRNLLHILSDCVYVRRCKAHGGTKYASASVSGGIVSGGTLGANGLGPRVYQRIGARPAESDRRDPLAYLKGPWREDTGVL